MVKPLSKSEEVHSATVAEVRCRNERMGCFWVSENCRRTLILEVNELKNVLD